MRTKKQKNYTSEYKAKVAVEAIRGDLTINEISKKYSVHSTQINRWKQQVLLTIKTSFNGKHEQASQSDQKIIDDLYRQIGQLTCENDFCLEVEIKQFIRCSFCIEILVDALMLYGFS
jgi:transposase